MKTQNTIINQTGRTVKMVLALIGFILTLSIAAQADTFHVTNTNDSGPGSLREAINQSNAIDPATPNLIDFQITPAGGVKTISLQSELPAITTPVVIDGTTQSGYAGAPIIELDGSNASDANNNASALIITAGNSTVKGLIINRFNAQGIVLRISGGNVIAGNYFGLDSTGTTSLPIGGMSIYINTSGNTIGGTTPAERNVISGHNNSGIYLDGNNASNNLVEGNYIGTDATGNGPIGNVIAIYLVDAPSNTIGGTTPAARNVIAGNSEGIRISGSGANNNVVKGNYVGTKTDGASNLSSGFYGVYIVSGASSNIIGGINPGEGNLIAFQTRQVAVESDAGNRNSIRGNSIFSSGQMGIDLGNDAVTANDSDDADTGANDLQNYPIITSAVANNGNVDIAGTLNSTAGKQFAIDFYSNSALSNQGNADAKTYLKTATIMTDGSGNASFFVSVPAASLTGKFITATATDDNNNTSELALSAQVTGLPGVLQFSAPTYSVNENGAQATITVMRTGGSIGQVAVQFATSDGTAKKPGDYIATSGTLSWVDGDASSKTFNVSIIDDNTYEQTEALNLTLSSPAGGATLGAQSTAALTIIDDEQAPDPADLIVTNTNDSGAGSLRRAIQTANLIPGKDTISFNIPSAGVHTITPLSALPAVTDSVVIDGYTQPGAKANTLAVGSDAVLLIELNGSSTVNTSGLVITAGNSTVRGLVINRFAFQAISLQTNGNDVIAGNYIGTNANGTAGFPSPNNNVGVYVPSANNTIGGMTPADRNVVSGNGLQGPGGRGILVDSVSATGNKVIGNYIGTDASGTIKIANFNDGVDLNNCSLNTIGGATAAERNVISGNGSNGITIFGTTANNKVVGNYIGTRADGGGALKNNQSGIIIAGKASGNFIGGMALGEGNLIGFNTGPGVFVEPQSVNNAILGNSIYSNGGLGIELYSGSLGVTPNDNNTGDADTGANNLQNFPVLTSVVASGGTTTIQGTLDSAFNTQFRVEFFSGTQCGEAKKFIGFSTVTTDASGHASFTFSVPTASAVGNSTMATATDPNGNTSEFSDCASGVVNGPGVLQFNTNSIQKLENSGSFTINVIRTGGSAGTVTAHYATASGTATAGQDFTDISGTLTFLDGEASKAITIPIVDDATPEGDETFNISLNNPAGGATLGGITQAQLIIQDNELPTVSISDVSQAEGNGGATAFTFTVTLSNAIASNVDLSYVTANGTATSGSDYQAASSLLGIPAGQLSKTITVQINGDTQNEPDETFLVNLSISGSVNVTITKAQGVGTILNDDAAPPASSVQLEQATYTVSEGAHYKLINLSRTGDLSAAASVDYATSDMSANQRTDYNIMLGTLKFAPGESTKTLTLLVTDDSFVEADESLSLTLSNPQGVTLGPQSVSQITITDNDGNAAAPNAIDDVPNFVRQHYHDFLNREPDAGGFQGWQDILNNCAQGDVKCDRVEVSSAFYRSAEFHDRGYFIYRFYSASLGKVPQYLEFMRDIQKVSGFLDVQQQEAAKVQFIEEFMARPDFQQKYGQIQNAGTYVDTILSTAGVTLQQRDQIVQQLQGNQITRGQALRQIMETVQVDQKFYDESFVIMQYFGYLRRDADVLYLQWIQTLKQTGDYRTMVNGFMNSLEYRQRFGQ
ncbi:MAG: hypothetical protein QOJ64_1723 [Acidobacteriota bacterium]|nr:hypothetical protein [Acidobacteriota bacterium]